MMRNAAGIIASMVPAILPRALHDLSGLEAILESWMGVQSLIANPDARHLAYMMATVHHETAASYLPVREGLAANDQIARQVVRARSYGQPDPVTGQVFYGRGFVQLTWAENYKRTGTRLSYGNDFYYHPDRVMEPKIAALILVKGMIHGWFTGLGLGEFFSANQDDPIGARKIINGQDHAADIAALYTKWLGVITGDEVLVS